MAGKLDTTKASVAFRTDHVIFFHECIMRDSTRLANPPFVTWASYRGCSLSKMTDLARAQIVGLLALLALMVLGAYIMAGG